jgi:hypothetical protein
MGKRCIVKTEGIAGVKAARNAALKACIYNDPQLKEELMAMLPSTVTSLYHKAAVEELILKRHIRVIDEHPVAHVSEGEAYKKYVVSVYHTIAWETD